MLVDPISNAITKIRNASRAKHPTVEVRASRFTQQVLEALKREGFIRTYKPVGEAPQQSLRVYLKYAPDRSPAIVQIMRRSRPGSRRYSRATELPRVLGGMGKAILTTSKGILTDEEARRQRIGGEVVCYVW